MIDLKRKWGVIQSLVVEADTFQSLLGATTIIHVEHKNIGFWTLKLDNDDSVSLVLQVTKNEQNHPLAFPLESPEETAIFIERWLASQGRWPKIIPNTDGSIQKGFRIEEGAWPTALIIKPTYIVYGK